MPSALWISASWLHVLVWSPCHFIVIRSNCDDSIFHGLKKALQAPTVVFIIVRRFACFWSKMPMFQMAGMRDGGLPLPPAFQYFILMTWRACDLNFVMISLLASKCQDFKLSGLQFHFIKQLKNGHHNFKDLPFWSHRRYHDQI